MSDPVPAQADKVMPEAQFADLAAQATQVGFQVESQLAKVLQRAAGNGRPTLIAMPGQPSVQLNAPGPQESSLLLIQAAAAALYMTRAAVCLINDIDTRIRPLLEAHNANQGHSTNDPRLNIDAGDRQQELEPGKVGDERGSQSPEAASGPKDATSQGSTPPRTGPKSPGGNPSQGNSSPKG